MWQTSPREYTKLRGVSEFNIQCEAELNPDRLWDGVCVPVIEWIDEQIICVVASELGFEKAERNLPNSLQSKHPLIKSPLLFLLKYFDLIVDPL